MVLLVGEIIIEKRLFGTELDAKPLVYFEGLFAFLANVWITYFAVFGTVFDWSGLYFLVIWFGEKWAFFVT